MTIITLTSRRVQAACLVVLAAPAAAQVQRGAITAPCTTASGAVLPGVLVQLTSDIDAPREAATGSRGDYRFQDLDPGRYMLRATLQGLRRWCAPDVIVEVGGSVEIASRWLLAASPRS